MGGVPAEDTNHLTALHPYRDTRHTLSTPQRTTSTAGIRRGGLACPLTPVGRHDTPVTWRDRRQRGTMSSPSGGAVMDDSGHASYGTGLSNRAPEEGRRLSSAETAVDPWTFRRLKAIGLASGMRCLEVGGGSGSIARWMADEVGRTGWVLVTDIDTSLLDGCERPNVDVRVHDIASDPLDASVFDVIHA